MQIEMLLSDYHAPIVEEGIDLAIRFGKLQDSTLVARKLCDMRLVVVAAPDYLERFGEPGHPKALATHNCLLLQSSAQPDIWRFREEGQVTSVPVSGSFRANSPRAVAHMAVGGQGIARCPYSIGKPLIEQGPLQFLFADREDAPLPLYVVYPPSRHLTARIRALIEHLAQWFQSTEQNCWGP